MGVGRKDEVEGGRPLRAVRLLCGTPQWCVHVLSICPNPESAHHQE